MAKYVNSTKLQKELFKRTEGYSSSVRNVYIEVLSRLINLVKGTELEDGKPFSFSNYGYGDEATAIFRELYSRVYQEIRGDVEKEWMLSNANNDELVKSIFGAKAIEDNHFARYLLEDANEKKNVIEPIEVFKRAHRMLMASQKGNQYKHYSFRVARHYSTFYSIYHKDFSFHERYDFFIACHEMLDAVEKYLALPGASKKDMVEETRKQLEELLINEN